ncbi:DUF4145 domain-containing protein [Laribacter hongkongensis]|uniref:DUF4145 domain-containing protein n=1 Tax=Laribacter hongkongensis TaxID=168471 RepID=UPI001EFD1648|nr:DUF4145 domain-containing protein [Laribacter hongkongensis]MCG9087354.1 DUF4145 domain-containing protein [Laribacter hongkongensis]
MQWSNLFAQSFNAYADFTVSRCSQCSKSIIWNDRDESIIFPSAMTAPIAHADLPEECRPDYDEARTILAASPRGAAALLRLCIQKLCIHLGGEGKNINTDIGNLVSNGLPVDIQRALDVVRVVGNNAVHPGEISLEDNPELASALFGLINLIVDNRIAQPKRIQEMFDALPDGAKEAVAKRDATSQAN